MDLEIMFDESLPPDVAYVRTGPEPDAVKVTVSPDVEAITLSILNQEVSFAIADAVDNLPNMPDE